MPRTRTALALIMALVAAAFVPPATAAAGTASLTITASRAGTATIALPADSVITTDTTGTSEQIKIAGNGRLLGLLLNRLGKGDQPSLFAYRTNFCKTPGCTEDFPDDALEYVTGSKISTNEADGTNTITLPAGTYAVTTFTDGAPIKVNLNLNGLPRNMKLAPTGPALVRYDTLDPALRTAPAPTGPAYSAGSTYTTTRPSYAAFVHTNETVIAGAQTDGACYYSDGPPPGELYANTCPATDGSDRVGGSAIQNSTDPFSLRFGGYGAFGPLPVDERFSIGQYISSAVPIRNVFALQVIVEFGTARGPSASTPQASAAAKAPQVGKAVETANNAVTPVLPATGAEPAAAAGIAVLALAAGLIYQRAGTHP